MVVTIFLPLLLLILGVLLTLWLAVPAPTGAGDHTPVSRMLSKHLFSLLIHN